MLVKKINVLKNFKSMLQKEKKNLKREVVLAVTLNFGLHLPRFDKCLDQYTLNNTQMCMCA
jgi:hypothetical protein